MRAAKFGGSSLATAELIRDVADIVVDGDYRAVVVSAVGGVTNDLIAIAQAAESGQPVAEAIARLRERHGALATILVADDSRGPLLERIAALLDELEEVAQGIRLVRECSVRTLDLVMSYGERLSAPILTEHLRSRGLQAETVDAREVIVTNSDHGRASVDAETTYPRIRRRVVDGGTVYIVTGFIAADVSGVTTTLGRNGSDYTASLVAAALGCEKLDIWTDVDGVLSADPRLVPDAFVIAEMSVQEAMEMSYFGAEVIHPYTLIPAVESGIPLRIRNTHNPAAVGTEIRDRAPKREAMITGLASIGGVALVNVEGGGMVGVPGVASRVFAALGRAAVNVVMISQASSEHSICIICREEEAESAARELRHELTDEIRRHAIERIDVRADLEIIAVIGGEMRGRPGVSGRIFGALGDRGINVLAIAQGSSEMNISLVVHRADTVVALNAIHHAFFDNKSEEPAR